MATINKISKDAVSELNYANAHKSPFYRLPPNRTENSRFGENRKDSFEKMKQKLEKAQIGSSLEILLQNRLGTYLKNMLKDDLF